MIRARISGIPCLADVTCTAPGYPAITDGHPDNRMPAEDAEYEVELYDRKGYRAAWLEAKMTESERVFVIEEYLQSLLEEECDIC